MASASSTHRCGGKISLLNFANSDVSKNENESESGNFKGSESNRGIVMW